MRLRRLLSIASLAVFAGILVAACASTEPGWTYQPAPSLTPPPSVEASAAPSAGASDEPGAGGEPGGEPGGEVVRISAVGIAFEQAAVTVPAGVPFRIEFANNDAGVPHNVAIRKGDANGQEVFTGDIFSGVETRVYEVPALEAGAYTFICTVHPNMVGTMTAE